MLSTKNYGEVDNLFTELTAQEAADVNGGLNLWDLLKDAVSTIGRILTSPIGQPIVRRF
jgi:hypothetical protein